MPLPDTIRVKLSSESAGSVSLTPVVAQDLVFADLLAIVMTATSEDPARLQEILKRGSIVSGATRYRWDPLLVPLNELTAAVALAPRSDPSRPFDAAACTRIVIYSGRSRVEVSREAAERRKFFRRNTFWDAVLEAVAPATPKYVRYIHRDKEDQYSATLTEAGAQSLRSAASLLKFASLAQQLLRNTPDRVDLYVSRAQPRAQTRS